MTIQSVMPQTSDMPETPEARALRLSGVTSVMVEKPVKYAIDPTLPSGTVDVSVSVSPLVYVTFGNLTFFPVNGYLSHCWTDMYGMELSRTINTSSMDSALFGPDPVIQWIADLLSDVLLVGYSYPYVPNQGNWSVRRFYFNKSVWAELSVYQP